MIQPIHIVDNTLVPHAAFEKAVRRIKQCYRYADSNSEGSHVLICGEAGTGKSRVLNELLEQNPPKRTADGLEIPILKFTLASRPTTKGLAEDMLRAIGDPLSEKGSESTKTGRLIELTKRTKTRAVMIDEFHHFQDAASHKVIHMAADWLKLYSDEARVCLFVAGLPRAMSVIKQNEQLERRFLAPVRMPRFLWNNDDHREEFCAILASFEESLSTYFQVPPIGAETMAFRFYCGTGGLIGYVTKLLRKAVRNAIDDERKTITLAQIEVAHMESIGDEEDSANIINPFSRRFVATPTEDLLEKVNRIGAQVLPQPPSRSARRAKSPPGLSLNHVLAAS
jgi:hypothetical protein